MNFIFGNAYVRVQSKPNWLIPAIPPTKMTIFVKISNLSKELKLIAKQLCVKVLSSFLDLVR